MSKIDFEFNETVVGEDSVLFNIIEKFEDKILERGLITSACPTSDFDFSIHVCTIEGKDRLAIDVYSDSDGFDPKDVDWNEIFTYVVHGLEKRDFFKEYSELCDGRKLDLDVALCLSGGEVHELLKLQ